MSKSCFSCIHHDACAFWVGEGFDKFNRAESCKFYEQKEIEIETMNKYELEEETNG